MSNILQALVQNPTDTLQKFKTFRENFIQKGIDPQSAVQELLNSGKMSQQQYEQYRAVANALTGLKM